MALYNSAYTGQQFDNCIANAINAMNNGGIASQGWASSNFAYRNGSNASGTWPISINGSASYANQAGFANSAGYASQSQQSQYANMALDPFYSNRIMSSNIYGGTWIAGTHIGNFMVTAATSAAANNYYQSWFTGKTPSGAWSYGILSGNNAFYFVYGTDANYNSNNNSTVSCSISTSGVFTNASKRSLKENIKTIDYSCLKIINSTTICSFNMKADPDKEYLIGFIADDTHEYLAGKNHNIMHTQNCISACMKAIQELSDKIDKLETEIKLLKEGNNS